MKSGLRDQYAVGILLALVVLVFASSFSFQFVSDDHRQIERAEVSAHPLTDALTKPVAENFYRPVFKLYLAAGRSVVGANPGGWHVLSVLMHAIAVLMVFAFCRVLGFGPPWAMVAAAIMAVHPVHVESVAWVSGVTDPLLTIFFLASLIGFIRWRQGSSLRWLFLCLGAALLALPSKETAVMLAPTMLLLEFTVLRGNHPEVKRRSWLPIAATVLMTLVYLVVRMAVLRGFSHQWNEMTFGQMALTWPSVLVLYLQHIFWPFRLSLYYDIEPVRSAGSAAFIVPVTILFVVLVAIAVLLWRTHVRHLWFAALWIPLLLAPVLYLRIYNHGDFAHDRYLYLPLLGVAILVTWLLERFTHHLENLHVIWAGKALAGGVILVLAVATYTQSLYYRSDLLLFYRAVQLQPNSDVALNNLAIQLFERDMLPQALELYQRANDRNPNSWMMQFNYALALEKAGRNDEADKTYRRAIFLNADATNVWIRWASMKAFSGKLDEAESILRAAIARLPREADLRYALGSVLEAEHRIPDATASYEHALQIQPGFEPAVQRLRALAAKR